VEDTGNVVSAIFAQVRAEIDHGRPQWRAGTDSRSGHLQTARAVQRRVGADRGAEPDRDADVRGHHQRYDLRLGSCS
jgi:hypothetical protein